MRVTVIKPHVCVIVQTKRGSDSLTVNERLMSRGTHAQIALALVVHC